MSSQNVVEAGLWTFPEVLHGTYASAAGSLKCGRPSHQRWEGTLQFVHPILFRGIEHPCDYEGPPLFSASMKGPCEKRGGPLETISMSVSDMVGSSMESSFSVEQCPLFKASTQLMSGKERGGIQQLLN